jgi:excisionase family DNA binding protein
MENPDVLRVPEAAKIMKVSRAKAYSLVQSGEIRAIRVGERSIRILREDLNAYLRSHDYLSIKSQ